MEWGFAYHRKGSLYVWMKKRKKTQRGNRMRNNYKVGYLVDTNSSLTSTSRALAICRNTGIVGWVLLLQ
jgi:hypothetical protein